MKDGVPPYTTNLKTKIQPIKSAQKSFCSQSPILFLVYGRDLEKFALNFQLTKNKFKLIGF
jgi:hypothetical protein